MPEISRFYGIVIKMFFDDHTPPHFHAPYSEHEALIAIRTLAVISGRLPARALGLVAEWALRHQDEFLSLWVKAKTLERVTGSTRSVEVLPGNRLEALRGDRRGFHAIRINDQWRIIFRWEDNGVTQVELAD